MGKIIKIAPSILAADAACLGAEVEAVEQAGADLLHVDIMDGHFVPNLSFGPHVAAALRKRSGLVFDVHLMLENPIDYIEAFAKAGADIITVQVEAKSDVLLCIDRIHGLGIKAGIVLNPDTPAEPYLHYLDKVEMALVMSVYPGFGGQKFIERVLDKVTVLRNHAGEDFDIEVDGGINAQNSAQVIRAGANVLVAGSSVFGCADRKQAMDALRRSDASCGA